MDSAEPPVVFDDLSPTEPRVSSANNIDKPVTKCLRLHGSGPNGGRNRSAWPQVRGYEILSVIGSGGMGIVLKARHRDLRRTVALKTIRTTTLDDPQFLERFHAEAEAVARIQHPNIIQVFEVGTIEPQPGELHPSPFIALEFVDGGNLSQRTANPQKPRDAAGIVEKLARAVHAAHRLGVIHRDLKPANVLLTAAGEPKIADFGLAKQLGNDRDGAGRFVTQAGTVMGTPDYMAPEQAAGAPATPAVDIYALGVILYELLTSRVPFHSVTAAETIHLVQWQDPVSPRQLQPNLPRDLETICLRCLEKAPDRRYQSAEALADDLQRFLDGRTIQARPVGTVEWAERWARRNPLPTALAAAVVAVALIGLVGVVLKWREAVAHAAAAETAMVQARNHARAERWERYQANIVASASALQVYNVGSARHALEAAPEEFRNWEWRHFHTRLDLARHVLPIFANSATRAEISADGRRVALVAHDVVRVWDTRDRREILSFQSPDGLEHLRLSPDGKTLAYRKSDKVVVLRDVDTNQVRAVLGDHERTVHGMHFIQGGARLVAGSAEQAAHVWDVRTGRLVRVIAPRKGRHVCVDFSADGRRIIASLPGEPTLEVRDVETGRVLVTLCGQNSLQGAAFNERGDRILTVEKYPSNSMRLWEADTGRLVSVMCGHCNAITHFAFSPDNTHIASSSRDQTIRLWDAATGRCIATLQGHRGRVNGVSFSPDGKRLLSASEDHTVRSWNATTGEALAVLNGHTGNVFQASWTKDGRTIVSLSQDGTVRLWDARTVENNDILCGHTSFVYGVAFHPDGEKVASASWDGTARVWEATTGRQLFALPHGQKTIVTSVAFHPSGKILATRARDAVRLWDLSTLQQVHRWDVPSDSWRDTRLVFSHNGERLATGCAGRVIRVWDVKSRTEVGLLRGHQDEIRDVAFSPDGRWLASVADQEDPIVRIWDLVGMKQVHALEGHNAGGYAVAFNASGTLLASGATDGTVRLWDTATWKQMAILEHGVNVYGLAFTPDGTRFACACADNSIRLWDTGTRQQVAELRGHGAYVHQIAFSPDGTRLVSGSGDHRVRLWDTLSAQKRAASTR